jgi:hypothetical protein
LNLSKKENEPEINDDDINLYRKFLKSHTEDNEGSAITEDENSIMRDDYNNSNEYNYNENTSIFM